MLDQFSDVRAYLPNRSDLILVATPKVKLPPMNDCLFQQPAPREELARIGVHSVADLNDSLSMDDAALRAFVPLYPSPSNSDYFPTLKLKTPVARFQCAFTPDFQDVMAGPWPVLAQPQPVRHTTAAAAVRQPASGREDRRQRALALADVLQDGAVVASVDVSAADWMRA
ncbi:hypothetical protein [Stenotrophomonas sp. TEPEL]|uniref:hypothetical protein n=1 Tax=Stenotrophomonas sp. TEPEL TaxID=2283801 RepID=UPI0010431F13|nr:hypothetical protein [Stenotrophomonas sp. TEPEL]